MIVSHDWLQGFVPHGLSADRLGELLSRHVATLDGLAALRDDLRPFVVGQVVASERIPDTKLSFNQVDDGSGTLRDVVCGAPNVVVGARYPFARTGTVMPGGALTIEKRKIRGFTSNGMLCSARELGLGQEHDGILTLDTDAPPGTPLLQVLPVGDWQLELDVLANRPDLLSQRGIAREVSALTGTPLAVPAELAALPALPAAVTGAREASAAGVTVRLEDAEGCPRYAAALIRGVTVGPSPEWLVQRLAGVGARSISNVVDATNYVLHALGQPTHAFDLARLAGGTVVVRRARAGESLTTLDGSTRTLSDEVLVIADADRATAIAGVMGGKDSEVGEGTTDILLEVAYFDPRRVRRGRRPLGIATDASYRFERGVDRDGVPEALRVAAGLIASLGGGTVQAVLDVGQAPPPPSPVALSAARLRTVLGADVPREQVERLLAGIGFGVTHTAEGWQVGVPSWRHDVTRDVDLIEEVARLVGFDALPDELRPFRPGAVPDHPQHVTAQRLRAALVAEGVFEVRPLPFVQGDDATHARVQNPLADDEPHLRRAVLETLASRAEYNLARMRGDVRLFEVGAVFEVVPGAALPAEFMHVAALVMGPRRPAHFTEPRPPAYDAWDAKALGERLAAAAFPGAAVELRPSADGALWDVVVDATARGAVRAVPLDAPVWAAPAFGVELRLGPVPATPVAAAGANAHGHAPSAASAPPVRYRPLPVTPAAEFDLALLVPDALPAAEVERVLRASGGELLERVVLFDEFRGPGVPAGMRSLAWRCTFRHPERTLRDKEIDGRRAQLLKTLQGELGVGPRTT